MGIRALFLHFLIAGLGYGALGIIHITLVVIHVCTL